MNINIVVMANVESRWDPYKSKQSRIKHLNMKQ